jgi:hypothetical protein
MNNFAAAIPKPPFTARTILHPQNENISDRWFTVQGLRSQRPPGQTTALPFFVQLPSLGHRLTPSNFLCCFWQV